MSVKSISVCSRLPYSPFPPSAKWDYTEVEALKRGIKAKANKLPYEYNPAAGVRNETEGMVKVVYEEGTERILGVQVIGAHAEDTIQIAGNGDERRFEKITGWRNALCFPHLRRRHF
jgi:pyruvate/2-oxoglutarate dehydrogenase complex dihydrolipoamide dehydrogenase (E3) component